MIVGVFISEQGEVQQIGDIRTAAGIISAIEMILPQLKKQEAMRAIQSLSDEEIATLRKEAEESKK